MSDFEVEGDDDFNTSYNSFDKAWKTKKSKGGLFGFSGGQAQDEDVYAFDFEEQNMPRGKSKMMPYSDDLDFEDSDFEDNAKNHTKKAAVAKPVEKSEPQQYQSALEKAQSMLNKYSQGAKTMKPAGLQKLSEFDEDDISLESTEDNSNDFDGDFSVSPEGLKTQSKYVPPKRSSPTKALGSTKSNATSNGKNCG